jgi:hypothetical protein
MRIVIRGMCLFAVVILLFSCSDTNAPESSDVFNLKYYKLKEVDKNKDSIFQSKGDTNMTYVKIYSHRLHDTTRYLLEGTGYFYKQKMHGIQKMYNDEGLMISQMSYKKGLKNGQQLLYSKPGRLMQECNYKDDKLDGVYKQWDENGARFDSSVYKNGNEIYPNRE